MCCHCWARRAAGCCKELRRRLQRVVPQAASLCVTTETRPLNRLGQACVNCTMLCPFEQAASLSSLLCHLLGRRRHQRRPLRDRRAPNTPRRPRPNIRVCTDQSARFPRDPGNSGWFASIQRLPTCTSATVTANQPLFQEFQGVQAARQAPAQPAPALQCAGPATRPRARRRLCPADADRADAPGPQPRAL